jgi:hypothetical protein
VPDRPEWIHRSETQRLLRPQEPAASGLSAGARGNPIPIGTLATVSRRFGGDDPDPPSPGPSPALSLPVHQSRGGPTPVAPILGPSGRADQSTERARIAAAGSGTGSRSRTGSIQRSAGCKISSKAQALPQLFAFGPTPSEAAFILRRQRGTPAPPRTGPAWPLDRQHSAGAESVFERQERSGFLHVGFFSGAFAPT